MGGQGREERGRAGSDGTQGAAGGTDGAREVPKEAPAIPVAESVGPAAVRAAAKAKAEAIAAARAAGARGGARQAAGGQGVAAATLDLSPELQVFAAEIQAAFPDLQPDPLTVGLPAFRLLPERLLDVSRALRAAPRPGLDYLTCVTGVDYPERIEVVYHLFAITRPGVGLVLKVAAVKAPAGAGEGEEDLPQLPSVTSVWPGAEWHEREVYDLLGVRFAGHPDLRRILTPEGFSGGYPLRKDYVDRREQRVRKIRTR